MPDNYEAILVVSFGGPEKREDVIPFLENVLRGKNVPHERLLEVAEHYYHFDGVSPINGQVREFIGALKTEITDRSLDLPIYWGNRNWEPFLGPTVKQMQADGIKKAIAFFTSAYSSYSGCRQYRENVLEARQALGEGAPIIDKLRVFYNHPDFVTTNAERVRAAAATLSASGQAEHHVVFTAHSIPTSMANSCNYSLQLHECCRLIALELGLPDSRWSLVYQSRSGRPQDPWLEPDVVDALRALKANGVNSAVVHPVGFLSDHMEVMYDLDEEAKLACEEIGLEMARGSTVGTHPRFVSMVAELIEERMGKRTSRRAIGHFGPNHDVCPLNCCMPPARPPAGAAARPTAGAAS